MLATQPQRRDDRAGLMTTPPGGAAARADGTTHASQGIEPLPDFLERQQLQVLDSQVQRQLDYEYVAEGEPNPETEFRHQDLDEEFQSRDTR